MTPPRLSNQSENLSKMQNYSFLQSKNLLSLLIGVLLQSSGFINERSQKSYKSLAQLIHRKLEKFHLAQNIEGERRPWAQLDQQQGKLLHCWYFLSCSKSYLLELFHDTKTVKSKSKRKGPLKLIRILNLKLQNRNQKIIMSYISTE